AFSLSDNLAAFSRDVDDPGHIVSAALDLTRIVRTRSLIVQGHIVYNEATDKYKAAMGFYRQAQDVDPNVAFLKTRMRNVQETAENQKREYEKLATLNPSDANASNELGLLRENEGDLDGAQQAFEHALQVAPLNSVIHLNLGRVFDS